MCGMHLERLRRRGRLDLPSRAERFWGRVEKHDPDCSCCNGCWIWTGGGGLASNPYGYFWNGEREQVAHRFAYELLVGEIPEGLTLDHLCETPLCVNPADLEPVTRAENTRRGSGAMVSAAQRKARSHCKNGHLLDDANTYVDATGVRSCRTCKREQMRKYRAA